jgi:hypothetical protein
MRSPEELLALFEARMSELGLSQAQLEARAFGKPGNSAIQNLKKGASPSFDRVFDIAGALGLELYLGYPRSSGLAEPPSDTDFQTTSLGKAGYLTIPWYEPGLGKGSAPVAIQESWLRANALNPETLCAVEPDVSLVADLKANGLVAIVEKNAHRRGAGKLWCLIDKGKFSVARVAWVDSHFVVMPAEIEQAPRLFQVGAADSPYPIGRVACLLVVQGR